MRDILYLVEGMCGRHNVLGKVKHVLGGVGRGHQVCRVQVQVMEHLVRGLVAQLELHLGEQTHHLVDVGTLLEERKQSWQGLQGCVS